MACEQGGGRVHLMGWGALPRGHVGAWWVTVVREGAGAILAVGASWA